MAPDDRGQLPPLHSDRVGHLDVRPAERVADRVLREPAIGSAGRAVGPDPGQRLVRGSRHRPHRGGVRPHDQGAVLLRRQRLSRHRASVDPIQPCQVGADCVYQRYLQAGRGPDFVAAGVTDAASFTGLYWSEQFGSAGTVVVSDGARWSWRGGPVRRLSPKAQEAQFADLFETPSPESKRPGRPGAYVVSAGERTPGAYSLAGAFFFRSGLGGGLRSGLGRRQLLGGRLWSSSPLSPWWPSSQRPAWRRGSWRWTRRQQPWRRQPRRGPSCSARRGPCRQRSVRPSPYQPCRLRCGPWRPSPRRPCRSS